MHWVQLLLSLILEVEDKLRGQPGPTKRDAVLTGAMRELDAIATASQLDRYDPSSARSYTGLMVDGAVGLLNSLGLFRHKPAAASRPATAPGPEAPPAA